MIQYTGANLKQRALIALRENPLYIPEPHRRYRAGPIVEFPGAQVFQIYLTFTSIRYQLLGLLPMRDLPEIRAAIRSNEFLQAGWLPASIRHVERSREIKHLLSCKSQAYQDFLSSESSESKSAFHNRMRSEYDDKIAQLEADSIADFAPWQPGLTANPDRSAYMDSISERAASISGITEAEENRLFVSTQEWRSEWAKFIYNTSRTPDQRKFMRSLKLYSEARVVVNKKNIGHLLRGVGDVYAHFTPGKLNLCISFSNEMAFKMCQPNSSNMAVELLPPETAGRPARLSNGLRYAPAGQTA